VYKLVELEKDGTRRYTAKYSPDKQTLPGAKQVFRYRDHDVVACSGECGMRGAEALLRPVILGGEPVATLPGATQAREHCSLELPRIRTGHRVEYSPELLRVAEEHNRRFT
jgi:nicotinate phosphoribosyltransferase